MTISKYFRRGIVVLAALIVAPSAIAFGVNSSDQGEPDLKDSSVSNTTSKLVSSPAKQLAYQKRAVNAEQETGNWLLHGRTYSEQRFSPLTQINESNVSKLGHAWTFDASSSRGLEATPIVRDGVMFTTGAWSIVYAIDARTGKKIWKYDPKVPGAWGRKGCCDIVNRGVAVWGDAVYSATFDGRLIALDVKTGELLWERNTVDRTKSATITGAPRIVNGKVIIGNGGAEYDVRGYVSAYDAVSGELAWRFYTVPNSKDPQEHKELDAALKTWSKKGDWLKTGGGGTAWDSFAFDPELNLLYLGTGNGAPHSRDLRSPGGGDHLYLSSIVALDADTGKMKWYYQTTPGDNWDYTATQQMILADIEVEGKNRKVLMQAPKNGFFYVLDRQTGKLLTADKFAFANWASHVDLKTGRPVETGQGDYSKGDKLVYPSELGGHNWHPMSYSPDTGLVYIPALERGWLYSPTQYYMFDINAPAYYDKLKADETDIEDGGYLRAWDPSKQKVVWEVKNPGYINGGTLSTAGNLVFQAAEDGYLNAYNAKTGDRLAQIFLGTSVIAPPISYSLDGEQYIALMAGAGGVLVFMTDPDSVGNEYVNSGRLIVLKLGGGAVPAPQKISPQTEKAETAVRELNSKINTMKFDGSRSSGHPGEMTYIFNCGFCHGMWGSKSLLPDLTKMSPGIKSIFKNIVLEGVFADKGMAGFSDTLDEKDVEQIMEYLELRGEEQAAASQ